MKIMTRSEIISLIEYEKIVAIIRLTTQEDVPEVIRCLVTGGIRVLEVTANTPGYLLEITKARKLYPEVLIGAGTVTNAAIAKGAIASGAQFLVTPNTDVETIKTAHERGIPVLMGALTPTEISLAANHGADMIKLFPAGHFGLGYFKAVKGPLSNLKFLAVGGVNLETMPAWLSAGVLGVGIGSEMVRLIKSKKDFDDNVKLIEKYREVVIKARQEGT